MGVFDAIPVRSNADTGLVDASWWNTIRTALVSAFGSGGVAETQFTIADNQTAYTNITGLSFSQSSTRAVNLEYTIYRTNGSSIERREIGTMKCMHKPVAGTWSYELTSVGDDALGNGTISDPFICNSSGQIQYKSDSIGATYVGTIRYKVINSFTTET